MTADPKLKVQRVDQPRADLLAIGLYGGERFVLLLHANERRVAFGTATQRPRGLPADGRVRQLRKRLIGARLVQVVSGQSGVCTEFEHADGSVWLAAAASPKPSERFRLVSMTPWEGSVERHDAEALRSVRSLQAGETLLSRLSGDEKRDEKVGLGRELRRLRKRLESRRRAIGGDLQRMDMAPALRAGGQMILSNLNRIKRGQSELTAVDYTEDPPCTRTLELDVRLGPSAQAERHFHRARRLERGRQTAEARLRETLRELDELGDWELALASATTAEDLANVAEKLGQPTPTSQRKRRAEAEERVPYRRYQASFGRTVLVGRGARDNDALTLQHARPWDLWLHARGMEGAHVVVPLARGEACPPELLVDAASLAAHHSKARGQATVDVQYVERRHVRKPRGFPPGAVRVEREKVLRLRLEPTRVRRLLAARIPPG